MNTAKSEILPFSTSSQRLFKSTNSQSLQLHRNCSWLHHHEAVNIKGKTRTIDTIKHPRTVRKGVKFAEMINFKGSGGAAEVIRSEKKWYRYR